MQRDYTVCFLFTKDHKRVLLQRKAKTDFAGRLNGVGGKVEPDETPHDCAARKIFEETGLADVPRLQWIGTLQLAENCDNHNRSYDPLKPGVVLYFYAGEVPDNAVIQEPEGGEPTFFCLVSSVLSESFKSENLAGDGDVQYFVNRGLNALEHNLV